MVFDDDPLEVLFVLEVCINNIYTFIYFKGMGCRGEMAKMPGPATMFMTIKALSPHRPMTR
jgi:hypothetical protein